LGLLGRGRRWLARRIAGPGRGIAEDRLARIEALVGQELQAQESRFAQLDAGQQSITARLARIEATLGAEAPGALNRLHADDKLWRQLALIPDLKLTGPARSVLFLHHSYYHFYYLAQALRRRGWRAVSVSIEDPNGVNSHYYHGEDVNLHDPDPVQKQANLEALFALARTHFDLLHFAGDGHMSFFPQHFTADEPPDIVEWKSLGKRVAYTVSGCNSATAQSSVRAWSRHGSTAGMCDNCPWESNAEVCSDERNLRWGAKVNRFCDLVFSELQPSLDYLSSRHANVVRGPVSTVLDPDFWRPDMPIPEAFRVPREPGEVLVYHAFGNYGLRGQSGRNIKGTPAIVEAVERLRAEGHPVRLMFFTSVPNETVRFYQAQADIVVDQLWAGSWGANGRESMMLGKPVVGFVHGHENDPADLLAAIAATPIVNATVDTVYEVLKDLVRDPARRAALGARSREFALAWHAADAGAVRYEQAYDAMQARSIRIAAAPAESTNP
jgi:hypothetical protein